MKKHRSKVFSTAIVEKRNVLNELRSNNMTLQELRFFSIYLSKINPYDVSTRLVRFPLSDFQRIMDFGRMNILQIKQCTDSLLSKIVHVPNESGYGYTAFQLFKRCKVDKDEYDEWYLEIDAHDEALPLMFEFKNRYFTYELWNALRLKSANQVRMYEILKQYEKLGKRELDVSELRGLLGISPDEYSGRTGWSDFKLRVLDSCQQALKENTDICFTYERGKTGKGGKWLSIIFHIFKNTEHKDPLSLNEFIEMQPAPNPIELSVVERVSSDEQMCEEVTSSEPSENYLKYAPALDNSCSEEELNQLLSLIDNLYPDYNDKQKYSCLNYNWFKLLRYDEKKKIKNKISYLMTMIINDFKETHQTITKQNEDDKHCQEIADKYSIFTKM